MDETKTSKNIWKANLRRFLSRSRKPAFVGIGQELRGDDAAGVLIIRRLQEQPARDGARTAAPFLFEAGALPEACSGPLRRFGPDRVVFFDAADMGEAPGAIRWIEPGELEGGAGGTHNFPVGGFARYLESELGSRVAILGIQPRHMDFDGGVSDEVGKAVDVIAGEIMRLRENRQD